MYKTIDLCAGIGGIRQGFCKTGEFVNVLSAEIDEFAAETYKLNFNGEDPLNDLTSIEFKNKAERVGCDVLLAGFPCQPFSSQGPHKRNYIFSHKTDYKQNSTQGDIS